MVVIGLVSILVFCFVPMPRTLAQQDGEDLKPQSSSSKQDAQALVKPSDSEGSAEPEAAKPEMSKSEASAPTTSRPKLIDTSFEEASTPIAPAQPAEPSDKYKTREVQLQEPLKVLIQASHLYDLSRGGSSELSDAFVKAIALGPASRDDLLFIIENGSPAGKIYAACLLLQFDRATGTQVLNGFKTVKTLVVNKSYTASEHYTMGEVATDLLSPSPAIILKRRSR